MSRRQSIWLGAAMVILPMIGFMLIWWNRGIQLNSNGMPTLAALGILAGKMPYRDFHFWCPPGHLLIYTALTACFGDGLIYVRAFAILERLATFIIVYFWLARAVSPGAAMFGTFAAAVGFCADTGDVIAHYGFDAVLASVTAGYMACIAMTSQARYARILYLFTGIFAGLCMISKQTQGVGVFLVFLVIFLVNPTQPSLRERFWNVSLYLLGWVIPTGATALWLVRGGAWSAFVNQNFIDGPSSKGTLWSILSRPFVLPFVVRTMGVGTLVAIALMCAYAWLQRKDGRVSSGGDRLGAGVWAGCLVALLFGCASAWWWSSATLLFPIERPMMLGLVLFSTICIFMSLFGNMALAFWYTWASLCRRLDRRGVQLWTLASVSATTAYMFSLSWAAFEQMLIPGFAFLTALALDSGSRRGFQRRHYAVVAIGLMLISISAYRKLKTPYSWENWDDGPIRNMTVETRFPEIKGIRMSPASAAFLEKVTGIIDAHSRPDETIFCFPNYALFYVFSHRQPGVFAYMHWFDIASDAMVREDAARIRAHPPAVILSVQMPDALMRRSEARFRNGARSGQREMLELIPILPGYHLIESLPIPYQDYLLNIYARK